MSDTRFTMLGIGLIFAGFIIFGIFGGYYSSATIQEQAFGDCFDYSTDTPIKIECSDILNYKIGFFILVSIIITLGVISLIKGIRGRWDQDVKSADMVGPK
ncbi:MAG: hypothetical protein R1F52_06060 [Candidatus Nitrosoabyssus spongiisocia]|nr:MAG: hypothetical protein R1F52_06060 [Nitrosopumilaceae archaeon AB1(1)]